MNEIRNNSLSGDDIQRALARIILTHPMHNRLPTVRELSGRLGASVGAVQAAFARLEGVNAINVDRHGRMGAFLRRRSVGQLWAVIEGGPMVVAFPLPASRRIEGLATALRTEISSRNVEAFSLFIRGSRKRISGLRQRRCHIAVMSSFAARALCSQEEEIALELPKTTFVREHVVLEREDISPGGVVRVAVDPQSFDQQRITEMEFGHDRVTFVPTAYMKLAATIEDGRSDYAVWSVDEITESRLRNVSMRPLSKRVADSLDAQDLRAALVVRSGDDATKAFVRDLDLAVLQDIQASVVVGTLVPEY